jgi:hypothetical protein
VGAGEHKDRLTDRYEPLPGVFGLPGFFLRKLSPRGRRLAAVLGVLLLSAAVVGAIQLVPRIQESKQETAERERRERAAAQAERLRQLRADQRPRFGRSASASVADVEAAITADAARRLSAGQIQTAVRTTDCERGPVNGRRQLLACTAVTSVIPEHEASRGGTVGYPYRAALDLESGRFALCKVSGRPGEGSLTGRREVRLPKACGG